LWREKWSVLSGIHFTRLVSRAADANVRFQPGSELLLPARTAFVRLVYRVTRRVRALEVDLQLEMLEMTPVLGAANS
jgi:hypothetical protein